MSRPKRQMTDEEALIYAEKLADSFLSSWSEELGSNIGQLFRTSPEAVILSLKMFGIYTGPNDIATLHEFASAIECRDRERLVRWLMQYVPSWPKDGAKTLVAQVPSLPNKARKLFAKGLRNIKLKRGPTSKLRPHEYPILAELGDRLAPLVLLFLRDRDAKTKRTLREMIEYQKNDFPSESAFLLKHLDRLEFVLKDKVLLKRAKKLPTLARLIADAMAGTEYDFEPRTSLERTRQGRRMARNRLP